MLNCSVLSERRPANPGAPRLSAVAIIPARYYSTRFPGKLLADLHGRPLIEHTYRRTCDAPGLDGVLVATDDERIGAVVESFGGRFVMTSRAHASGTDRLAEAAAGLDADLIVNVQGDEPLIEPAMIAEALGAFEEDPRVRMATLGRRTTDAAEIRSPHVVKVVVDRDGRALYFSRAPVPYARDMPDGVPHEVVAHIGLYVYRRSFLLEVAALPPGRLERIEGLEQLRVLEHGHPIQVVNTTYDSYGVDTPDDLERVRRTLTAEARS